MKNLIFTFFLFVTSLCVAQIGYTREEIIKEYGSVSFSREGKNYSFVFVDDMCVQWEMNTTDASKMQTAVKRLNDSFLLLSFNTWKIDDFVKTQYIFEKGYHRFITYYSPN